MTKIPAGYHSFQLQQQPLYKSVGNYVRHQFNLNFRTESFSRPIIEPWSSSSNKSKNYFNLIRSFCFIDKCIYKKTSKLANSVKKGHQSIINVPIHDIFTFHDSAPSTILFMYILLSISDIFFLSRYLNFFSST